MKLLNFDFKRKYLNFPNYWQLYLNKDIEISRNLFNLNFKHFFNEVAYTRWPFYLCISIFLTVFYLLLSLKRFDYTLQFAGISFLLFIFFISMWFRDLLIESSIFGKYNRKVKSSIIYGFLLFIVSECFLFSGFFWAYFDRFFNPTMYTANSSLPYGIQSLFKSTKSFIATLLLVSSGVFLNYGIYLTRIGSWIYPYMLYTVSTIFGILFLYIQYYEYSFVLMHNVTENVYSSLFFFLTGFHGVHVLVGLCMLLTSLVIFHFRYFVTRERHMFLMISTFYWHFVDIIWIFLYLVIYIWNFNNAYYYAFDLKNI